MDSLETRAEPAVLRTYVENQAILEPILLYRASKCKQRAARTVYEPVFLPFYKIIVSFFSFFCQDANKTRSNCAIIGYDLSKKHKLTLYKTLNGEPNYVIINFSLIFVRSYLYKNLGTYIQIIWSWLVGWCMYCVTLRLHDIKKL